MKILEVNNTIKEIKRLYGINSRMKKMEERISEVKNRIIQIIQTKKQIKKQAEKKNKALRMCETTKDLSFNFFSVKDPDKRMERQATNQEKIL